MSTRVLPTIMGMGLGAIALLTARPATAITFTFSGQVVADPVGLFQGTSLEGNPPAGETPFTGNATVNDALLETLMATALDGFILVSETPVFDPTGLFTLQVGGNAVIATGIDLQAFVSLNGPFASGLGGRGFTLRTAGFQLAVGSGNFNLAPEVCLDGATCHGILAATAAPGFVGIGNVFDVSAMESESVPEPATVMGLGIVVGLMCWCQRKSRTQA